MTGDINYKGKISTSPAISFINNEKNTDGNGIKIGGGIDTIIGAGQSVQPTSTYPGIILNSTVTIRANLDGNAVSSTYAKNGVTSSNFTVSDSSTPLGSSGYIRFESGIQICWGTAPAGKDKVTVTLPMPFKNKNYIVTIGVYADIQHGYCVSSTTQTTTTFQMVQNGVTDLKYGAYAAFRLWR